ncbi:nucleotidyltransferase domain-containing protein [Methylobacterium sp. J-026]|uniref:nucleotidyltransferase family protein n=1 Tax=Methylobacterium sp. J-026 TaxID=2836624 RepID=UPI001FBBE487|nr:nucleotidyltransferase domain-containing protein [Methylobacterium sp. J-026]MCJ2137805.1 nucleotidyltransferase domain-containing protein [Methylobacterium sp. J-026]
MDKHAALDILRANEAELRRRGVLHAALFGSVARGEAGPDSDLDVMIEIDTEHVRDVFSYVGLCRFIGDLFPIPVDVADRQSLKASVRKRAEHDAVPAF